MNRKFLLLCFATACFITKPSEQTFSMSGLLTEAKYLSRLPIPKMAEQLKISATAAASSFRVKAGNKQKLLKVQLLEKAKTSGWLPSAGLTKEQQQQISTAALAAMSEIPANQYEHYMDIIKKINPTAHERIKEQDKVLQLYGGEKTLLQNYKEFDVMPATEKTHFFPRLVIYSSVAQCDRTHQEKYLESLLKVFGKCDRGSIGSKYRTDILDIIKSLAPELHAALMAVDPTGINHVAPGKILIAILCSRKDNLPILLVNHNRTLNQSELRFAIAHELGHYALGHCSPNIFTPLSHKELTNPTTFTLPTYKRSSKPNSRAPIRPLLSFEETFLGRQSQMCEYEADAFAIMNLGVAIEGAVSFVNNYGYHDHISADKFSPTHPSGNKRLDHIESLATLQEARGANLPPINWQEIREKYKNNSW